MLSPNAPAMLEAHYAVPLAGGVLVADQHAPRRAPRSTTSCATRARVLLVDHALAPLVEPLDLAGIDVVRIDDSGAPGDPYEQLLAPALARAAGSWLEHEEEPISINYTSGTTGAPKGVVYTHRGAYLNALAEVIVAGLSPESRYLWTLPMFHCNGWCFPWAVTAVAARHVTDARGRPRPGLGADRRARA